MLKIVFLVAACVVAALSQSPSLGGHCPNVPAQQNFDLSRYLGNWYEIYAFPAQFEAGRCTRAHYTLKNDSHVEVYNRYIDNNGNEVKAIGDAYVPDDHHPANLLVRFAAGTPYGKYNVIDTDYSTYTLIYSCETLMGVAHIEFAWLLARDMHIDDALAHRLMTHLSDHHVDITRFHKSDQENCPP